MNEKLKLAVQPLHPAAALKRTHLDMQRRASSTHMEVFFLRSFSAKTLVFAGVFVALTVLFTYVFSIQTPFLRLSFGILPIAVFGALFGPLPAGCMAMTADLLGTALYAPGLYFPGFTLSSFCCGMICGYFLHQKQLHFLRICMPFLIIFLCIDLGLNTLWLTLLYHKAASAFFLSRLIKGLICLPIYIGLFQMIYKPLIVFLPGYHLK